MQPIAKVVLVVKIISQVIKLPAKLRFLLLNILNLIFSAFKKWIDKLQKNLSIIAVEPHGVAGACAAGLTFFHMCYISR
jgi:hypothetical protein